MLIPFRKLTFRQKIGWLVGRRYYYSAELVNRITHAALAVMEAKMEYLLAQTPMQVEFVDYQRGQIYDETIH